MDLIRLKAPLSYHVIKALIEDQLIANCDFNFKRTKSSPMTSFRTSLLLLLIVLLPLILFFSLFFFFFSLTESFELGNVSSLCIDLNAIGNSCYMCVLQPGKIWGDACQIMVGREPCQDT